MILQNNIQSFIYDTVLHNIMTKKKIALMCLAGIAMPLVLTFIGLPLWIVTPVSLAFSCAVDGVILYKLARWIMNRRSSSVIHN